MPFLSLHHLAPARHVCTKTITARYLSQQTACDIGRTYSLETDQDSFEGAGIRPAVAASLRIAFPNVRRPTTMQRKLIRGITKNRDVLLQDDTGTGKYVVQSILDAFEETDLSLLFPRSFAAMLALLSKLRAQKGSSGGTLTGLLIVPHRDLAYQYLHWIHHMTLPEGDTPSSLTRYAQVLVRHLNKSTLQGLPVRMQGAVKSATCDQDLLIHQWPHILIATPNTLLELIERHPEVCQLPTLSTVVVDEVDALLRIPDSKPPKGRRRAPQEKLGKHIPDLVRILDRFFLPPTDKQGTDRRSCSAKEESLQQGHTAPAYRPQLIMISATLRSRLQSALFNTFGWVQREKVLKLNRKRSSALPSHRLGRSAIHHVLVVSKTGDIRNIVGARPLQAEVVGNVSSSEKEVVEDSDEEDVVFCGDNDDAELVGDVDEGKESCLD